MLRLQAYRRATLCRKQNTFKCVLFLRCKNGGFLRKNHRSSRGETVYNLCYFGLVMWFTYPHRHLHTAQHSNDSYVFFLFTCFCMLFSDFGASDICNPNNPSNKHHALLLRTFPGGDCARAPPRTAPPLATPPPPSPSESTPTAPKVKVTTGDILRGFCARPELKTYVVILLSWLCLPPKNDL